MTTVRNVSEFKRQGRAGKLSILAMLLFPLVGLVCLAGSEEVAYSLPYVLGGLMVFSGFGSLFAATRDRDQERTTVGTAIVMVVLGAVSIANGASSLNFIGIMWGLLGLTKGAEELDVVLKKFKAREPYALTFALAVFELVLAVLLIMNPFANIGHHVIVLGLELIAYPFKISRRDDGKISVEADA